MPGQFKVLLSASDTYMGRKILGICQAVLDETGDRFSWKESEKNFFHNITFVDPSHWNIS